MPCKRCYYFGVYTVPIIITNGFMQLAVHMITTVDIFMQLVVTCIPPLNKLWDGRHIIRLLLISSHSPQGIIYMYNVGICGNNSHSLFHTRLPLMIDQSQDIQRMTVFFFLSNLPGHMKHLFKDFEKPTHIICCHIKP